MYVLETCDGSSVPEKNYESGHISAYITPDTRPCSIYLFLYVHVYLIIY